MSNANMMRTAAAVSKKYLFWCINEHIEFRVPELKSIASLFKIPLKWAEKPQEDPFLILEMDSEQDARKLVSRCMLVKACYELWGDGGSLEEMHTNIKQQPLSLFKPHLAPNKSFRVRVEGFNKTLSCADKLTKIESLNYLPFEGPVNLSNPDTKLCMIEYYGLTNVGVPELPYRVFLGRQVGEGCRELIARYSLKQRSYIGSTSMDAQLAFIMANMAQLVPGHVVLDPFVGTGSILVSAAHHGAYILGSDIDFLTLHARTKPTRVKQKERSAHESILSNLSQYGLESRYLDVAVVDCARTAWRRQPLLDAIITDPPYGIREATARVGRDTSTDDGELTAQQKKQRRKNRLQLHESRAREDHLNGVELNTAVTNSHCDSKQLTNGLQDLECVGDDDERCSRDFTKRQDNRRLDGSPHYPSKINYGLSDVFKDLLNFAASNLVVGGRLVFWIPVIREEYSSSGLPSHPCLKLTHNSEQVLNCHSSRRLLTYVKTRAAMAHEEAEAEVADFSTHFREKFFIAAQMTREERVARKCLYSRDKRGQGLGYRVTGHLENAGEDTIPHYCAESLANSNDPVASGELNGRSEPCQADGGKSLSPGVDASMADVGAQGELVATGSAE